MSLGREDVEQAARRIAGHVRRTPVLDLGAEVDPRLRVVLKLELLQHAGSFKARGAMNNVQALPPGTDGVCAASGGNHAAAVAWAARCAGIRADVFAPAAATPAKLRRVEEYGATLHRVDGHVREALLACESFADEHDVPTVHPYDTVLTAAGAGTVGLEVAEQVPDADLVLVACGGGGLYAGLATALADRAPVQPVEPEQCPHLHDALLAGEPVDRPSAGAAADSLGPPRIGSLAFEVARAHDAHGLLVTEDDILAARRFLWSRARVLAEPGACVALAALLSGRIEDAAAADGATVVVVVSGGNNDALPA